MERKRITLLCVYICILSFCPLLIFAQNYEQRGDGFFKQAQYEKAEIQYKAAVEITGASDASKKKLADCKKCIELLNKAKSAEESADYEAASQYYTELYSIHARSEYKNKANAMNGKAQSAAQYNAEMSNGSLSLDMSGNIGTSNGILKYNQSTDSGYYTYWLSGNAVTRTINMYSFKGNDLVLEAYDKSGKYIGKFYGTLQQTNGQIIYQGTFTNYKGASVKYNLKQK